MIPTMIKVGDIIDGRKVTKVFTICGQLAYQSEPVANFEPLKSVRFPVEKSEPEPVETEEVEQPKRGRRKKEA